MFCYRRRCLALRGQEGIYLVIQITDEVEKEEYPSSGDSMCKGPVEEQSMAYLRTLEKACVGLRDLVKEMTSRGT